MTTAQATIATSTSFHTRLHIGLLPDATYHPATGIAITVHDTERVIARPLTVATATSTATIAGIITGVNITIEDVTRAGTRTSIAGNNRNQFSIYNEFDLR